METQREEHMNAVKWILRYVSGTESWGVTFSAGGKGEHPCLEVSVIAIWLVTRWTERA
jgi:hypothetical protein